MNDSADLGGAIRERLRRLREAASVHHKGLLWFVTGCVLFGVLMAISPAFQDFIGTLFALVIVLAIWSAISGGSRSQKTMPARKWRDEDASDAAKLARAEERRVMRQAQARREAPTYGPKRPAFGTRLEPHQSERPRETWWTVQSAYYKSEEWQARRGQVLQRDGRRCRLCGAPAEHVHHLEYRNDHSESDDQLVSLCASCHDKAHGRRIRSFGRAN
jgi:5-methylcytosine-specific restriction endonuclease McrA